MSIGKAQAQALADKFLDTVGSGSVDDLQPREVFTEVILIAGELVEDAQKNLDKSGSNSSGDLSASIVALEPVENGSVLSVDIEMLLYGLFVNKGVKGTRSGSSKADYKFTKDAPSSDFVDSIKEWLKRGKHGTRNVKKAYKKTESKNKSLADESAAWVVARSIMRKGIKPTGFFDKAVKKAEDKYAQRLGKALEIDIITSITK